MEIVNKGIVLNELIIFWFQFLQSYWLNIGTGMLELLVVGFSVIFYWKKF